MIRTGDPLDDFDRYEEEQWQKIRYKPKCAWCEEHIQQEDAVCIDDNYFCDQCLKDLRVYVDEV